MAQQCENQEDKAKTICPVCPFSLSLWLWQKGHKMWAITLISTIVGFFGWWIFG